MDIQRSLINNQVYDYIKEKIINDEFKPNEKIDVTRLSKSLNVSKTPVTTALSRLQHDGFITVLPQSGTFVRHHSEKELYIIYKCRAALERTIVECYGGQYDRERLSEIKKEFNRLAQKKTCTEEVQNELFALELNFHDYLVASSEEIIRSNIVSISDLTKHSRLLYIRVHRDEIDMAVIRKEARIHSNIIDSILAGNYTRAGEQVYEDIMQTFDGVKQYL